METRNSSFEDHMSVVDEVHKVASSKDSSGGSLLTQIAEELNLNGQEKTAEGAITAPAAPAAEGEVSPAASSVAGAAPTVTAATDGVAVPQTAIAGGNEAEAQAGEVPAPTKPNEGLAISAGDNKVTDANNLHKTPEAVTAAAEGGGGDEGSAATPSPEKDGAVPDQSIGAEKTAEAEKIGQLIAESFQKTLEKQAADNEYAECVEILKEAGLLDGYEIKQEPMTKEASYEEGGLKKLANKQPISRQELIGAAVEFVELQKEAAVADEKGREDAHSLVKLVGEMQKNAGEEELTTDQEKVASALEDKEVVSAVKVLKAKGIL